jgi:tRNA pseudouridine55 synthase
VGRALDVPLDATTALFSPPGEFLALYQPRDGAARAVAVFV